MPHFVAFFMLPSVAFSISVRLPYLEIYYTIMATPINTLELHYPMIQILIPSFSSKCGHVTEKHVPIGCKHEMLGNQTYEVLQPLSKLSRQSLKLFDCRYVFDKQIRPKLQTRYSSVQGFQK